MFKKLAEVIVDTIHDAHQAEKSAVASSQTTSIGKASSNKVTVCVGIRPRNQKESCIHHCY